jgi:DNA-binding NarL/FixJ family response regulator
LETPIIRILLVDDFAPWRSQVSSMLEKQPELRIIAEVENGLEAVLKAHELQPDLIFLDIGLPGLDGIEAARRMRRVAPKSKILFVSQESSAEVVRNALGTGAVGYLLKLDAGDQLLIAVQSVLRGERFISKRLVLPG